jgi:hypothetical protein
MTRRIIFAATLLGMPRLSFGSHIISVLNLSLITSSKTVLRVYVINLLAVADFHTSKQTINMYCT